MWRKVVGESIAACDNGSERDSSRKKINRIRAKVGEQVIFPLNLRSVNDQQHHRILSVLSWTHEGNESHWDEREFLVTALQSLSQACHTEARITGPDIWQWKCVLLLHFQTKEWGPEAIMMLTSVSRDILFHSLRACLLPFCPFSVQHWASLKISVSSMSRRCVIPAHFFADEPLFFNTHLEQ